jgi:hypothetical protein
VCDPFPRRSLAEETPSLESESAEDGSPRPAAVADSRPGRDLTDARTHTKYPHRLYSEGNMDDSAANALATIRFYISDVLLTVETRR